MEIRDKTMEETIKKLIKEALKSLNIEEMDFTVEHPEDLKNGDYSANVAMICAKKLKTNPKELAERITGEINKNKIEEIKSVEVKNGFINFYLSINFFINSIKEISENKNFGKNDSLKNKKIMVEYTQPNPFKPFHIGHLMSNAIGESISRLVEFSGADVVRANYQGDIGLHIAKAVYGLFQDEKLQDRSGSYNAQASNIGKAYVFGAKAYENDEKAKQEIDEINKKIYTRTDEKINETYAWGFKVTMEAFEDLYKILGTKFDFYFLESQMMSIGQEIVKTHTGDVFEKSDEAIVFKAEKHDSKLHTRVFITSQGLPTYETKELGLTVEKFKIKPDMDLSIVVTASEQMDYMRVVAKAISLIYPEFGNKMKHITHGMLRFATGKMGSRKGNVITGESLLNDARSAISEKIKDRDVPLEEKEKIATNVGVSAIKYSILKQAIGGDIIYDFEKSLSFEGDSGPYLQYSYARANSILEKARKENIVSEFEIPPSEISEVEKLLYRFPETVLRSTIEYEPHHITGYLIEIARAYNSFYGNTQIVSKDDKESPYKIALTKAFVTVLKNGLYVLGITAPEKM